MKLIEQQLERETIYEGKIFNVYKDQIVLPDGQRSYRELVIHHGGVCIAAQNREGCYFMVDQYRYPIGQIMREFPAGKREANEAPLKTAQRELIEETGYQAREFIDLGAFVPTCGYSSEIIYMYYAADLTFVGQHLDENEFLNVAAMKLDDIITRIMNNEIQDAKTIIMAFKLRQLGK